MKFLYELWQDITSGMRGGFKYTIGVLIYILTLLVLIVLIPYVWACYFVVKITEKPRNYCISAIKKIIYKGELR